MKIHYSVFCCLLSLLLTSVSAQTFEEMSRADNFLQQKKEALQLIQNGQALAQTRDEYSATANFGKGGYVSNAGQRRGGKDMIVKGNLLLSEAEKGLRDFSRSKEEIEKFVNDVAEFKAWESADGRQVKAAIYSKNSDSVTLVRPDGLAFPLNKHQLADKHQNIFNSQNQVNERGSASHEAITIDEPAKLKTGAADSPMPTGVAGISESELPSIKDCLDRMISELSLALEGEKVKAIGVSRFYVNGTSQDDLSSAFLFRILEALLSAGDFDVFDRSSLSVVMTENKLQYLVSGGADTFLEAGEAIVVGDLLYTKNCSEAFVVIRAVDTSNSEVLFAQTARARISPEEMKELGLANRDITTDRLPRIKEISTEQLSKSLERAKAKSGEFSIVFDTPKTESLPLWSRIGYFKTLEHAFSAGMVLFDRDLLLTLFEEAGLSSNGDQMLSFGDALISVKPEETKEKESASIKIYRRDNSALIALAELAFTDASDDRIEKPWDDSFAATLKHMKEMTEVSADDLKFTASFKLDDLDREAINSLIDRYRQFGEWVQFYELTPAGNGEVIIFRSQSIYKYTKAIKSSELKDILGEITRRLSSNGLSVEAIKRESISVTLFGFDHMSGNQLFPGLWWGISDQIQRELTISKEGEAAPRTMHDLFSSFPRTWIEGKEPIYEGKYEDEKIRFNYSIDYRFSGIYPEWVTLEVDLTPMKDKLYKVIKNENKNN